MTIQTTRTIGGYTRWVPWVKLLRGQVPNGTSCTIDGQTYVDVSDPLASRYPRSNALRAPTAATHTTHPAAYHAPSGCGTSASRSRVLPTGTISSHFPGLRSRILAWPHSGERVRNIGNPLDSASLGRGCSPGKPPLTWVLAGASRGSRSHHLRIKSPMLYRMS